ncbi:MAG: hypothetical protein WD058_04545 [Dehalococcoidia bacterium]
MPATPAFRWLLRVIAVVTVAVLLLGARGSDQGATLVGTAAVVLGIFALLEVWLLNLQVEVDGETLTAAFGPLRKRLRADDVAEVRAERYQWLLYGGWGVRFGLGKRRAWTVPFLNSGVRITHQDGTRYYISSRSPDRLAAAVADLVQRRGIRG